VSEPETLGTRLRSLRSARGCSLSELSRRSGIGKGTISELENDRRGARLDTLFALTTALGAPLGALLPGAAASAPAPDGEVRGDAVAAILLGRWDAGPHLVEVYRATVTADEQHSAPHGPGVEETVTVVAGRVRVGARGAQRELGAGESLRYRGDQPHHFTSLGPAAEVILLMHYPRPADGGAP
jgi:transcriptional regulator with XRE-family HTH domain